MQNLSKTNELPFDLAQFQVEELEERLENRHWFRKDDNGPPTSKSCMVSVTTYLDGSGKMPFLEIAMFPMAAECPDPKICVQTTSAKSCF